MRTVVAPQKLVGEKLTHTYDWAPHLTSPNSDALTDDLPTILLEKFDDAVPDVAITGISVAGSEMTFTVGAGGPAGFNLAILWTAKTTGGQEPQVRIVVPIVTR